MHDDNQDDQFRDLREQMVSRQLESRGIRDQAVLEAMRRVPRHLFVPENLRGEAYADKALPLGARETISQPYVVALMLEALALSSSDRVLDIGTGSGYQTALLAELAASVISIDINRRLSEQAKTLLFELGYRNIKLKVGDGEHGSPEDSPFDAVIVSAAASTIPRELVRQLADNGRMIVPLGDETQFLVVLEKRPEGLTSREIGPVRFVRMHKS